MVRHWILIPAFPGSNPGSAVREGTHYCVLFLYGCLGGFYQVISCFSDKVKVLYDSSCFAVIPNFLTFAINLKRQK